MSNPAIQPGRSYISAAMATSWISRSCQLPGVDVMDHGADGVGVHGVDVDLSLPGLPHVGVQHGTEDWRLGAEEIFVNSEFL